MTQLHHEARILRVAGTGAATPTATATGVRRAMLKLVDGEREAAQKVPLTPEQRELVKKHVHVVPPAGERIKHIYRTPLPLDDLVGYGCEGFSLAAQTFNEARDVPFHIYGLFRANGAMLRAIQLEARHCGLCGAIRRVAMEWLGDQDDTVRVSGIVMDSNDDIRTKARAFLGLAAVAIVMEVVVQVNTSAGEDAIVERETTTQARRALREAIRALPDHLQKVVDAVHGRRLTLKDAAAEAGIPYPTYKRRYREALDRLAVAMRARGVRRAPPVMDLPEPAEDADPPRRKR